MRTRLRDCLLAGVGGGGEVGGAVGGVAGPPRTGTEPWPGQLSGAFTSSVSAGGKVQGHRGGNALEAGSPPAGLGGGGSGKQNREGTAGLPGWGVQVSTAGGPPDRHAVGPTCPAGTAHIGCL